MSSVNQLQYAVRGLRDRIVHHEVYARIATPDALRRFMEHHVFAVWDFMTLLKALQRELTCVEIPWRPKGDNTSRRLINDIVLAEESDEDGRGGFSSHFEMYHEAMREAGADTKPIDRLLELLGQNVSMQDAVAMAEIPPPAARFVKTTWKLATSGSLPSIAAAFTLGREELIPDLFRSVVSGLARNSEPRFALLNHYLDRHIHLDEDEHSPMAFRMLESVCGTKPEGWKQAQTAAQVALESRLALWDGIAASLD